MPWLLRCNWWFLWPWKFLCQAVLHTERKIYIAERLFYFPKRSKSSWIEPHLAYLIILWNGKGTMVSFPWLHISSLVTGKQDFLSRQIHEVQEPIWLQETNTSIWYSFLSANIDISILKAAALNFYILHLLRWQNKRFNSCTHNKK